VRRACVGGLGALAASLGDARESTGTLLAESLRTDLSYSVQAAACEALAKIGGETALVALRAATDYPSPDDRVGGAALRGRLALEDGMAVDEVFTMARGQAGPKRRALGLQSLGGLSEKLLAARRIEAVELLKDAAEKTSGDLQRAAVASLGDLRVIEAEELLKRLAQTEDGPRFLRFVARNALQNIEEAKKKAAETLAAASAPPPPTVEELSRSIADLRKQLEQLGQRLQELEKARAAAPPAAAVTAAPAAAGGG
jgi:hypothetical protein